MLWLWILLAVVLLIVLLCMTRVGVWAAYDRQGTLRLVLRLGPLRLQLLPAKEKKGKKPKKKKSPKKKKKKKESPEGEPGEKEKKKLPFTLEDIQDALRTLLPALGKALRRLGRGIQIKPLQVSVTLGGQEDPAKTAQLYGEIQAAVWSVMPHLEKLIDIWDPGIHIGVDFGASSPAVEGEAGVTFRIGTLIAVGFGLAVPALKWLLRWRKRSKAAKAAEKKTAEKEEEPAA